MAPMEERHAELLFELLDRPADRRLREEKFLTRLGEGQVPCRRLEAGEQAQARHHIPISHVSLENLPFEHAARRMHSTHAKKGASHETGAQSRRREARSEPDAE